jgi:hypothetical protein
MRNIDTILRHYLACAVWTGTGDDGEPLESMGWTADDFHWDSINKARLDIERFVSLAGDLLDDLSDEDIGLNFWLTRNSRFRPVPAHGPGFWDRDLGEAGNRLLEIARKFRECDTYIDSSTGCLYLD